MKGYPKRLNTKEDYEYVRANFPEEQWRPDWQALLDSMKDWVPVGTVESLDAGVNDETHKVISEGEGEEEIYTQCELQVIPSCRLLRLGFTEDYVRSVLETA